MVILALLVFLAFTALLFPKYANPAEARLLGADGKPVGMPDARLFYNRAQLYQIAVVYGSQGRQAYLRARFSFDALWPLIYTFFFVTTLSFLGRRTYPDGSPWRLLNLLPLAGILFDYLENIAASIVMARYPVPTPVVAELAGYFTLFKWLFIGLSFLALVIWLVLVVALPKGRKKS